MKFRKGNNILYGQDHRYYRGIPSGIDFTIVEILRGGSVVLEAPGYGVLGGHRDGRDYGNGCLYARGWHVVQRARRILKATDEH